MPCVDLYSLDGGDGFSYVRLKCVFVFRRNKQTKVNFLTTFLLSMFLYLPTMCRSQHQILGNERSTACLASAIDRCATHNSCKPGEFGGIFHGSSAHDSIHPFESSCCFGFRKTRLAGAFCLCSSSCCGINLSLSSELPLVLHIGGCGNLDDKQGSNHEQCAGNRDTAPS